MFTSGYRNFMSLFLQFSRKSLQQGQSLNIRPNPDFTGVLRTVTFFNRGNFVSLLRSTVSVSPAGKRRGRAKEKYKKILNNPNKGQSIGFGEANIIWPGLNAQLVENKTYQEVQTQSPDPEFHAKLTAGRNTILKRKIFNLHDLERGWAGRSMCGRTLKPPESVNAELYQDIYTVPLEMRLRSIMTSTKGKCKKVSVFLAVGNKKGALGVALGNSTEPKLALRKAFKTAVLKLNHYKLEDPYTINHDFYYKFGKVKIFAYRRSEGHGLICHRAIAECCKLIGIKDLYVKVKGSKNTRYIIKAFLLGLVEQKSFQQIANESGYHVVEFKKENMNYPKLLASPVQGAHKEQSNVIFQEFVMGNLPLAPFKHINPSPQFELNFKKTHYRRNLEDVKMRIMAKHGKLVSHLSDIYPECERMK